MRMSRYFIHMAYDGSNYCGWQIQPNEKTVQEVIEHSLSVLLKTKTPVTGAGRTDTGVHASFYIAHFESSTETCDPTSDRFIFKLNSFLPGDIVVYRIYNVPDDKHARFSAKHRTYQYHIASIKPIYRKNYSHYVFGELDIKAINSCCDVIMDTSDFTSFAKLHSDVKTNNCKVSHASWKKEAEGYLFEITADRFLRNMVRSLTGTLIDVGRGKLNLQEFIQIVEAKDRGKAGSSAPARGLFLTDIAY